MVMSRVSVHDGLGNMLFDFLLQTLGSTTYVMTIAVAQKLVHDVDVARSR